MIRHYKQMIRLRCRNMVDTRSYRKASVIDGNEAVRILTEFSDAVLREVRKLLGEEAYEIISKKVNL